MFIAPLGLMVLICIIVSFVKDYRKVCAYACVRVCEGERVKEFVWRFFVRGNF